MLLTVAELARAVGKSENYVRQHIFRKHLTVQKDGRNISVALDEASRWASERQLAFEPPAVAGLPTEGTKKRTARMTVLTLTRPDRTSCNLLTVVRHRRRDALGPWSNDQGKTWTCEDLGNDLRLFSLDAPLEHCQALVEDILQAATLMIDGEQIDYALEPKPRRHRAFRDKRGLADGPIVSPFPRHSAEIVEYRCFAAESRKHWLNVLGSRHGHAPLQLSRLGVALDRFTDRVGNLLVVGAEDAVACGLVARRDRTLVLHVDTEELLPGAYRAAVWSSHAGDEVLRQELAITQRLTTIDLASDVDHVGFAIFRTMDGQCIDLMEAHLILQISGRIQVSGPTMQLHDRRGRLVHEVNPAGARSRIDIRGDAEDDDLDKNIRQRWLDRRVREREATARREGNFERFGPDAFQDAVRYFTALVSRDADQGSPIYLADPYFVTCLTDNAGTDLDLKKLCIDIFAATAGSPLNILCAKKHDQDNPAPWWSALPEQLIAHVRVRAFLSRDGKSAGFHDRYLITPKREIIITHSINGWHKDGVTFASLPYDVYRAEAEWLWNMDVGSLTTDLLVRKIGR